jgi:hypothetical protein
MGVREMAAPKPFETKTVESTNPLVEDKLNPSAELQLLVGGPYIAADGEEHKYGHTALRLKSKNFDLTYDFGRYGKTTGMFGESGEGILRVWADFQAYIKGENSLKRTTTAFVYLIFDHQAIAAKNYFAQLVKAGKELTGKKTASVSVYKLATDYHALGPNCTTLSVDGAKIAVPKIDNGSEKFNRPEDVLDLKERLALSANGGANRLFLPANLQKFLSTASPVRILRTDVHGGKK